VTKGYRDQSRPRTLEILGPPGSGKTALIDSLQNSERDIVPVSIYWRKPENLSVGVRSAFAIAPIILDRISTPAVTMQQVGWMIRLHAALPIFYRKLVWPPSIVAFDQGPVYTMARLSQTALLGAEGSRLRRWWDFKLDEWSKTLDLLILLDAPNEILIERIRRRSKSHVAKARSDDGAAELLTNERAHYETVVGALGERRVIQTLRFDTSVRSVDEITTKTLTAIHATRSLEGRL
jgi:hypothetical protein